MIRIPAAQSTDANHDPFKGSTLADWLSATNVYDALREASEQHAARTALTWIPNGEPGEQPMQVVYADFIKGVTQAANLFRSLGVQRDDVVAFLLPSLIDTQYVLWGAETAGAAAPINFLLHADQIAGLLQTAGAKVLVAFGPAPSADIWQKALQVRALVPDLTLVKVGGGPVSEGDVVDFDSTRRAQPVELTFDDRPGLDSVAAYFHTGGTTGLPKLATHTHQNQLAAAYGGVVSAELSETDIVTNGFPMFHVAGTIFCSLSQFLAGAEVLILSAAGFRNPAIVKNFWRIVERHRATIVGAVPTALAAILGQDKQDADISSLRIVITGAASLPRAVAQEAERITGRSVCEVLGMTEAGGMLSADTLRRGRVLGSAGHPIAFCEMEARQVGADGNLGRRCSADETGVLVVRGPNIMPGYKNPAHNAGAFTEDGWFISGDLGYLDQSGRVFITGREKDLIIRSGHNIDPVMIEDAFLAHPAVAAAAAVAMPDAYAGELPVAFVVLKPGAEATTAELQSFVESRIHERPAYPKQIHIVPALPVTGIGKIFKPALRNECATKLFADVLSDEPIATLTVGENSKRGKLVEIALDFALDVPPEQRAATQKRIAEKLGAYLVSVAWREPNR